jgi:hypothetical protein
MLPYKQNQKEAIKSRRVQNLKLFKATILRYEAELPKAKALIKDINLFVDKFKLWLFGIQSTM